MFHEWMTTYEPEWLFTILAVETFIGFLTLSWVKREYYYDANKDIEKKQRRTKTTKKTVTQPTGVTTTEETSEVSEPVQDTITKGEMK